MEEQDKMGEVGWKEFFQAWPAEMPRRGLVITSWSEQIAFDGFLVSPGFLLISRQTPDSLGARLVIVPFEHLTALKLTDVVKAKSFQAFRFEGSLGQR
jgi:hypothetical protein